MDGLNAAKVVSIMWEYSSAGCCCCCWKVLEPGNSWRNGSWEDAFETSRWYVICFNALVMGESSVNTFMGRPIESCQPRATLAKSEGELLSREFPKMLISDNCGVGLGYSSGRECIRGDGCGAGDTDTKGRGRGGSFDTRASFVYILAFSWRLPENKKLPLASSREITASLTIWANLWSKDVSMYSYILANDGLAILDEALELAKSVFAKLSVALDKSSGSDRSRRSCATCEKIVNKHFSAWTVMKKIPLLL